MTSSTEDVEVNNPGPNVEGYETASEKVHSSDNEIEHSSDNEIEHSSDNEIELSDSEDSFAEEASNEYDKLSQTTLEDLGSVSELQDANIGDDMDLESDISEDAISVSLDTDKEESFIDVEKSRIGNKSDDVPLYIIQSSNNLFESPITYKEHLLSVCAYVSRHNCSDTQFRDLLNLLNLHVPANNLVEIDINKVKAVCGFDKDFLRFHFYCSMCKKVFNEDIDQCPTNGCIGNQELTKNYFVTGNLEKQLLDVLLRQGIWQCIQEQSKVMTKSITDITNGSGYQMLKEDGCFLEDSNNITLSFFTDGVPLFKSSGVSLWPVYLIINEIPRKQRFLRRNMILWGVWQGTGKPNMTMFLSPLVQDLNKLYTDGVKLTFGDNEITCKAKLVLLTMDLQARASVLHMTQHNGEYPCNFCMVPGEVVKSGKGHARAFAFKENGHQERTEENIRNDAKLAQQQKRRVRGFTGESVFLHLLDFNLSSNVALDYMHGILLGVNKKILTLWTDTKNSDRPFYIGKYIKALDKAMKQICPPYMISRLPRTISAKDHWKASEFRSWLLFYAIPCLTGRLEGTYLLHFSTLVEATYILLGEGITENELQHAHALLCAFVEHTEKMYGKSVLGLNFHNLTHLVACVRQWGPLWAWSCFCFESFNGELKKSVHGTGNVCRQIFWAMQVQKKLETENLNDEGRFGDFVRSLTDNTMPSKKSEEFYQCFVPECKQLEGDLSNIVKKSLADMNESCLVKDYERSKKIIRNGFQMYSKSCSRVRRRNSYTLQLAKPLQDGSLAIEVDYYLINIINRHVFAVGKRLKPVRGVLAKRVPHLQIYEYCT